MSKLGSDSFRKMSGGIAGLMAGLAILIAVNVIMNNVKIRKDLTAEKLYSLSSGTKGVLSKLDQPVTLKFFFSNSSSEIPVFIKNYASQVKDLLHEYKIAGGSNIIIEQYDPKPDSDDEEWAQRYGVTGQNLDMFGSPFYFGLVASSGGTDGVIPALDPRAEKLLEYNITRLIYRVVNPQKPVIGVMSSLPVLGSGPQQFRMPNQPPPAPAWISFQEIQNDYTVRDIPMTEEKISSNINTLVLAHPKELSDKTLFAIDQFMLRGGKLIVFLDPFSAADAESNPAQGYMRPDYSSNLAKLLSAWGVGYDPMKVLADMRAVTRVQMGNRPEESPVWLSLTSPNMNKDDILISQLESIMMPLAGTFIDNTSPEITFTPLISSSESSALVNSAMAQYGSAAIRGDLKPGGTRLNLAVRLTGKFKTAFPDGAPKDAEEAKDDSSPDKTSSASKTETTDDKSLKEGESSVILVGDVDMLYNRFCVQELNFFGTKANQPFNDNLNFFANAVEQMSGSSDMISIRSRGKFNRPFDKVLALQEKAQQSWHKQEEELQNRLTQTQAKIQQMQSQKDQKQQFILNTQQKQEIDNFRQEVARIQKQLRDVRKNLRSDIELLGMKLKVINIALIPVLVCIVGVSYGIYRRKKK